MSQLGGKRLPVTRQLLVEGSKDMRLIPYLMGNNGVSWDPVPVEIRDLKGNSLKKADATAFLKQPGLRFLGIIIDADESASDTWQKIRGWFGESFPDMSGRIPKEGFISSPNGQGIRLGVWIMPDNEESGMLETFLTRLIQQEDKDLWDFAIRASDKAKSDYNAPFKAVHQIKAQLHTFLAWQDEPGPQLHIAVKGAVLDPKSPYSQPIVTWFRKLFEL